MHLWYCRTPDDDTVLAHMLLPFAIDAINEFSPEDFFSFFENQAVRPMCPSDFLKSVCAYLRFDGFSEPDVKRVLLRGLCPIIGSRPLWAHYSTSGFLAAVRYTVDSLRYLDTLDYCVLLEAALDLLL